MIDIVPEEPLTLGLTASPWVRLTYLFSDGLVDQLGGGTVCFSCRRCGSAQLVSHRPPVNKEAAEEIYGEHGDPLMRGIRDAYEAAHQHLEDGLRCIDCDGLLTQTHYGAGTGDGQQFRCAPCYKLNEARS